MGTEMDVYQDFMPMSGPETAPPVRRMDIDSLVLSNPEEMENGTEQQDVKSKDDKRVQVPIELRWHHYIALWMVHGGESGLTWDSSGG